jgi:hypothetical protein
MPAPPSPLRFPLALLLLVVLLAVGVSCGDNGSSSINVRDYIAQITDAGATLTAVRHGGSPPAAGAGPTLTVTGGASVVNGGTAQVTVTGNAGFTTLYIAVDGVPGYYQVDLPSALSTIDLLLTLAQHIPRTSFDLNYAASVTGSVGTYQVVPVQVIRVGTGEVQVSISWDAASDVDLHVVEPGGEEIYYGNTVSATGGKLDLDSNADCVIDGKNNENITWANAPSGTYIVRVDYYKSCGVGQTNYVVTVNRKGHPLETFTGSLTGAGDQGDLGSGTQVTTFTFP